VDSACIHRSNKAIGRWACMQRHGQLQVRAGREAGWQHHAQRRSWKPDCYFIINNINIMAQGDQRDWYEALKHGAVFSDSDTTDLKLVEVLRYPCLETPRWSERRLKGTDLQVLFDEVRKAALSNSGEDRLTFE